MRIIENTSKTIRKLKQLSGKLHIQSMEAKFIIRGPSWPPARCVVNGGHVKWSHF